VARAWSRRLAALRTQVSDLLKNEIESLTGRVRQLLGSTVEVEGVEAAIGDAVHIERGDHDLVPAEVVAVRADTLVCQPLGDLTGVRAGAPVEADSAPLTVPVGPALLGRVLDGLGRPLDGALPPDLERATVHGVPPHPLRRQRVTTPLPLGVRALDTLVPFGRGQRTGRVTVLRSSSNPSPWRPRPPGGAARPSLTKPRSARRSPS